LIEHLTTRALGRLTLNTDKNVNILNKSLKKITITRKMKLKQEQGKWTMWDAITQKEERGTEKVRLKSS